MSQRTSGFNRRDADLYETPAWLVDALAEHVNLNGLSIWEPACGTGKMVRALEAHGAHVTGTDINDYQCASQADVFDFVGDDKQYLATFHYDGIFSNPPYGHGGRTAVAFIERGLERLPPGGILALLLPVDFDSAKGRAHLFGGCPYFAAKIVLRRRIMWFEPEPGKKPSTPSANHAWYIWVRSHLRAPGPAVTLYAPSVAEQGDAAA